MFEIFKNLFNNKDEEEEDLLTKLPDNVALLNNQGSFLWCNDVAQKTLSKLKENFSEGYIPESSISQVQTKYCHNKFP